MDYGKKGTKDKIKSVNSKSKKYTTKAILALFKTLLLIFLAFIVIGGCVGLGMVKGIIDNAPDITDLNITPDKYSTTVYDSENNVIQILLTSGSNRQEAKFEELPQDLIDSFVAIEDARFWTHNGIDVKGILRAVKGLITKDFSGGGSTITQQLIKNQIFNGGMESSLGAKLERKLQEQYLAIQLEKTMSKELILVNYLNTINLGSNTLGVKVAAKRYFNKELTDLTLSECAVIAGITQNPSRLNPITGREKNEEKRKVILRYMYEQGFIEKSEQEEALADDVYSRIQNVDIETKENSSPYSYFIDELTEQVLNDLINKKGYTEDQASFLLYSGGLTIYTTQDPRIQAIVDDEISKPENYKAARYSIEYRLSVTHSDGITEHYSEEDIRKYNKNELGNNSFDALYDTDDEINASIEAFKAYKLKDGDEIAGENIKKTLQPQASFVLMDQKTGYVKAISGGRGEKTASLTLNRATNTLRQPGSVFKTITAFAPAIDTRGDTLGSVYYDSSFTVNGKTIANWWNSSNGYVGYANLRSAMVYSMNVIATRTLTEKVKPELGFDYAKNFGITSLVESRTYADGSVKSDITPALALGGITDGVSNLELTASYAAIANGGIYNQPIFYTKILDHNGKILINNEPESHRVIKETTAFLLTDALSGSMESSRILASPGVNISATSPAANIPGMSNAGKSGTTTSNVDIWFSGYTPYYTASIWAGCDKNQKLSSQNGGASFHKPIWRNIMTRVHEGLSDPGFQRPDGIETASICRKSGKIAITGICDRDPRGSMIYTEYFAKGTVPTDACNHHVQVTTCSVSGLLAGEFCPGDTKVSNVYMVVPPDSGQTDDSKYAMPSSISGDLYCNVHTAGGTLPPNTGETDETSESSTAPGYVPGSPGPINPSGGQNNGLPGTIPTQPPSTTVPTNPPAPTTAAPTTEEHTNPTVPIAPVSPLGPGR